MDQVQSKALTREERLLEWKRQKALKNQSRCNGMISREVSMDNDPASCGVPKRKDLKTVKRHPGLAAENVGKVERSKELKVKSNLKSKLPLGCITNTATLKRSINHHVANGKPSRSTSLKHENGQVNKQSTSKNLLNEKKEISEKALPPLPLTAVETKEVGTDPIEEVQVKIDTKDQTCRHEESYLLEKCIQVGGNTCEVAIQCEEKKVSEKSTQTCTFVTAENKMSDFGVQENTDERVFAQNVVPDNETMQLYESKIQAMEKSFVSLKEQKDTLGFAYEVLLQKYTESESRLKLLAAQNVASEERFNKEVIMIHESLQDGLVKSVEKIKHLESELAKYKQGQISTDKPEI